MQDAQDKRIRNIIQGAFDFAGTNAEIGTIGWCYGGGWALQARIMAEEAGQAVVMYYGMPEKNVSNLNNLHADHAFANPSNPAFDETASKEAYDLAIAFLKQHLDYILSFRFNRKLCYIRRIIYF